MRDSNSVASPVRQALIDFTNGTFVPVRVEFDRAFLAPSAELTPDMDALEVVGADKIDQTGP